MRLPILTGVVLLGVLTGCTTQVTAEPEVPQVCLDALADADEFIGTAGAGFTSVSVLLNAVANKDLDEARRSMRAIRELDLEVQPLIESYAENSTACEAVNSEEQR